MAAHNICFYNKYGFCKYLETCRKHHENKKCDKINCEIRECHLRHPKVCKFFRDLGFCKFSEWCKFSHNIDKPNSIKNDKIKKLEEKVKTVEDALEKNSEKIHELNSLKNDEIKKFEDKLKSVEDALEKNSEKIQKFEAEIKDMEVKITNKDQTLSKINKKYNLLKEKVTLVFDLEGKVDTLEKHVEKISNEPVKANENPPISKTNQKSSDNATGNLEEIKCNVCEFVAKNKFGLKIHCHKKHSTATFNCFTCDFTCETHSELVNHNDKYYYSHRITLNKDYEKHILDEFQRLDEDGFLIHRKLDW